MNGVPLALLWYFPKKPVANPLLEGTGGKREEPGGALQSSRPLREARSRHVPSDAAAESCCLCTGALQEKIVFLSADSSH